MTSIPVADAPLLAPIGRRTTYVRALLAAIVVCSVIASALLALDPNRQTIVELPRQSTAIVVLDVSASISSETFSRIGTTLSSLAESRGRYGLVVFSDQAYEALPPGTPAANLKPLIRYFTVPANERPGFAPQFPANPWTRSFSAGTRISAGLSLAHELALDGGLRRPAIVLVSDLDDDPQDVPRLGTILLAYRRDKIPVRVVALDASAENLALFERLLGRQAVVRARPEGVGPAPGSRTPLPWPIIALAIVAATALATLELWSPRLDWSRARS